MAGMMVKLSKEPIKEPSISVKNLVECLNYYPTNLNITQKDLEVIFKSVLYLEEAKK